MIGGGTWEGAHARHETTGVRQPVRRRGRVVGCLARNQANGCGACVLLANLPENDAGDRQRMATASVTEIGVARCDNLPHPKLDILLRST